MQTCLLMNFLASCSILTFTLFPGFSQAQESDDIKSYQYISPIPGSAMNLPEASIIIREGDLINESSLFEKNLFEVIGSKTGKHMGDVILSSDKRTLIYYPSNNFAPGEEVFVSFSGKVRRVGNEELLPIDFNFFIRKNPANENCEGSLEDLPEIKKSFNLFNPSTTYGDIFNQADSLPADFPNVTVSISNDPAPGYIFLAPYNYPHYYNSYLLIIDNGGTPIFYQKSSSWNTDFTLQPKGYLSYWDQQAESFLVMDSAYSIIDSFGCANGYSTNFHEFLLLENDHSILMSYDFQTVRMDTVVQGGDSAAVVIGLVIQELDSEKNVVLQWRSWDHIEITDATEDVDLMAHTIDYIHGNAIEVDWDGNLLLSSRHLDEITKIDRKTGKIIWRWGGKKSRKNEFLFINDPITFSHQHDIRRTDEGTYTIFDNGNLHTPSFSRGLEYELDENAKTATLIWEFNNDPKTYARAMGSTLKLENDNVLIGWGLHYNNRSVSEIKQDGTVALELFLPDTIYNYRAFKFPWNPTLLITEPASVAFKSVLVGDSAEAIIKLLNNSSQDGEIIITGLVHKDSSFIIKQELPFSIPPKGSGELNIKFRPFAAGYYTDTLHIRSDTDSRRVAQILVIKGRADTVLENEIVYGFLLEQNYPNPFNLSTKIKFTIPSDVKRETSNVILKVYDVMGNETVTLVNGEKSAGSYEANFKATGFASGIYFYQLKVGELVETKKMVLLK